ncbi:MAG: TIGR02530 family flagellar biosynthesis protein [Pseudobdellovibrio sp.]
MDKMKTANSALTNGLDRIQNLIPTKPADIKKSEGTDGASFKEALGDALKSDQVKAPAVNLQANTAKTAAPPLKFSNHAVERMQSRGISYSPEDLTRLGEAVQKAAAKGSKDTLVLMDSSALIVSVKNNTVVTVMDKNALKENVFTNIDSTIVM